jgi:hypothetical protein
VEHRRSSRSRRRACPLRGPPYELTESAETYGEAVAAVLGVDPDRLFKTLVTEVDGNPTVAIVPVSSRLSTKSLARAAGGKKADMIDPDRRRTPHRLRDGRHQPVRPEAAAPHVRRRDHRTVGHRVRERRQAGLQVEVAPADLIRLLNAAGDRPDVEGQQVDTRSTGDRSRKNRSAGGVPTNSSGRLFGPLPGDPV